MLKNVILFMAALIMMLPVSVMAQQLPKEAVEEFSRLVHNNMAGAMIGDNHIITAEEAEALEYPLFPYEMRQDIIVRGLYRALHRLATLNGRRAIMNHSWTVCVK